MLLFVDKKDIIPDTLPCIISSVVNDLSELCPFATQEGTSGQSGMDEQSGLDGQLGMTEQSDLADQPPQTGEDVAAEAVEESDFTQPWDVPRETRATPVEPVDIPAVAGLQGSVAASPSVSQISQFLDTLNAPAEGRCS